METLNNQLFFQRTRLLLDGGNNVRIRLVGQSMYPFLHQDTDILIIVPKQQIKFCIGDIVLACHSDDYILHRIVDIQENKVFLLQGDANIKRHEAVKEENIIGRLDSIERNGYTIDCNSRSWRMKGMLWVKMRFARKILFRALRFSSVFSYRERNGTNE